MNNQAIAQGTLKADGTLVVNQKLHLTPGPVLGHGPGHDAVAARLGGRD